MTTKLEKELRREILIEGEPYTIAMSPQGVKLTAKGRRKGYELAWKDMVSGHAAVSHALTTSLEQARAN